MQFAHTLTAWYEENKRSLPWRGERDPYKIWVSEIILQQTRVQQGWDYYLRFIDTFPDIQSLADATEEEVLRVWQGLGYYSRARNMHCAAQQIITGHNGRFPSTYDEIRALKGIGDYTAAAISSIAFALPHPAVDGNVLRIVSRIFGVCEDISQNKTRKKITAICEKLIDKENPGAFNQALMDFGATQCTPQNPQCSSCPFQTECYAFGQNMTNTLPIKSNNIVKKERYLHFVCYIHNSSIILERRSRKDIWRNMYQFPMTETSDAKPLPQMTPTLCIREVLTHQIIHASFYIKPVQKFPALKADQIIANITDMEKYPMPKIMVEFIKKTELSNEQH